MAEQVYKKITELDVLAGSLDGNETLPVVKSGKTYKRSWANFFGTGWITSLLGAFTAFKAPDADHADDADTVGGEDNAALHNAALLTGNINLDRIPAELTGKNAATATLAATASACSGNAATADKLKTARTITISGDATGSTSFDGSGNVTLSLDVTSANTSQACSGNAETVGGVDPVNGNAGTFSDAYVTLSTGGTWIIPKGTYIFTGYANSGSGATSGNALQILNTAGSIWFPNNGHRGPFQGMIISDGVHFRLYNADPTYICISFYRKIA